MIARLFEELRRASRSTELLENPNVESRGPRSRDLERQGNAATAPFKHEYPLVPVPLAVPCERWPPLLPTLEAHDFPLLDNMSMRRATLAGDLRIGPPERMSERSARDVSQLVDELSLRIAMNRFDGLRARGLAEESAPREPMTAVSGVRSSCESVARNPSFIRWAS